MGMGSSSQPPELEADMFRIAWGMCATLLLASCTSVTITKETSQPTKPAWISQLPRDNTFFYYIGSHSGAETLEKGENAARKDALAKVAEYLGIDIKAQLDMTMTENDQSVKEHLKTKTEALITQATIVDSYHEKTIRTTNDFKKEMFDVYLLLKYPKAEAQKELARREAENRNRAQAAYNLFQSGKIQESQGNYRQARQFFHEGMDILSQIPTVVSLDQPEVHNTRELASLLKNEEQKAIGNLRRVVVWVQETNLDKAHTPSTLGASLQAVLTKNNFSVADQPIPHSNPDGELLAGDKALLAALKSQGVQYLIASQAHTIFSSTAMNKHFYKAQGVMKVFSTQTGETLITIPIDSQGYHQDPSQAGLNALKEAGTTAGDHLVKELLAKEGV